jgi:3'-phosphoadenosine 5'-phosphosulfate sulfotransferase (PAPS reductase)/FAD synthetase
MGLHFLFNGEQELNKFTKEQRISSDCYSLDAQSNYSKYLLKLHDSNSIQNLSHLSDFILNNNFINADYLVYDFEHVSKSIINDLNNNQSSEQHADLKFLLNKINLDEFFAKLKNTTQTLEQTIQKSTQNEQICISFNGGKDCCVVLYLYYAIALRMAYKFPLNVVEIQVCNPFQEMDHFVDDIVKKFYQNCLKFIIFDENNSPSKSLKECLRQLKTTKPEINFILMGTRRSDGAYFKNMNEYEPTDGDWPRFIRVNPILDWNYSEIWFFMRLLKLPYCSLYDRGYTSVDNTLNTVPNEALKCAENPNTYLPAYLLENGHLERQSRKKT